MYANYFNFNYLPFDLTPDVRQYTAIKQYSDIFSSLQYCVKAGHGFLKVSGGIGLGKTLLCRLLLNSLGADKHVIYLPSPPKTPLGLSKVVASELGVKTVEAYDYDGCVRQIYLKLIELRSMGKSAVVLLDECQGISPEALESLRLIANLDAHDSRLLQVIIFGSTELDELLMSPKLAAFRQRIVLDAQLRPLSNAEAKAYLLGRIFNAGGRDLGIFSHKALDRLLAHAKGNPRVLNILANLSLMSACSHRHQQVLPIDVNRAVQDSRFQVGKLSSLGTLYTDIKEQKIALLWIVVLVATLVTLSLVQVGY